MSITIPPSAFASPVAAFPLRPANDASSADGNGPCAGRHRWPVAWVANGDDEKLPAVFCALVILRMDLGSAALGLAS
jgi:hypothetical protein